jgi:hypothetical protein
VFSDDGRCVADARVMRRALEYVKPFGGVISQHARTRARRAAACCHEGETLGSPRPARLAGGGRVGDHRPRRPARRHTGSRVHVAHVSTAEGRRSSAGPRPRASRDRRGDPAPPRAHDDLLAGYDPSTRSTRRCAPTTGPGGPDRAGLADGTIDAVATDHAPHARHDKEHAFEDAAFGMLGPGDRLRVVHDLMVDQRPDDDGRDLARLMSVNPARIAGLADHGRPIAAGEPANLVLVDPSARHRRPRLAVAVPQQPLARHELHRRRRTTILRGRVTAHEGSDPRMLTSREARRPRPRGRPQLPGRAYGASRQTVGEAVFSTGMTGYQETLTDPSYHRQVVVMTAPHIGNTGWNDEDDESGRIWVSGYVVRDPARGPSNWRSRRSLDDELDAKGVVGISDIDTRALTRHLRERGAMRVGIFSGDAGAASPERAPRPGARRSRRWPARTSPPRSTTGGLRRAGGGGEALHRRRARPRHQGDDPRPDGAARHRGARAARDRDLRGDPGDRPGRRLLLQRPRRPGTAEHEVDLLRAGARDGIPYFGICFGNQILGRRWASAPTS